MAESAAQSVRSFLDLTTRFRGFQTLSSAFADCLPDGLLYHCQVTSIFNLTGLTTILETKGQPMLQTMEDVNDVYQREAEQEALLEEKKMRAEETK